MSLRSQISRCLHPDTKALLTKAGFVWILILLSGIGSLFYGCEAELRTRITEDSEAPVDSKEFIEEDSEPEILGCEQIGCPDDLLCRNNECTEDFDFDGDGVPLSQDCNDLNAFIYPDAIEICDHLDNNCNQQIDEGYDRDNDGFVFCLGFEDNPDCDDNNPEIQPNAIEVCDGIDNNCNNQTDENFDLDQDGYSGCENAGDNIDCDDNNDQINPGAAEICDGIDNNCDQQIDDGSVCVGCSDGQRDELNNISRWPEVAACSGSFGRMSLRATRTGNPCGDDLSVNCQAPEDLCAQGWHICMRNGLSSDLRFRLEPGECRGLSRPYVAATNNCSNSPDDSPRNSGCNTSQPYSCYTTGWCSAPVVCGPSETSHCAHAVWPNQTRIFGLHAGRTENNGCGNISTSVSYDGHSLAGVLCCLD